MRLLVKMSIFFLILYLLSCCSLRGVYFPHNNIFFFEESLFLWFCLWLWSFVVSLDLWYVEVFHVYPVFINLVVFMFALLCCQIVWKFDGWCHLSLLIGKSHFSGYNPLFIWYKWIDQIHSFSSHVSWSILGKVA